MKHDPQFIRKADHSSHIASSILIYQNITEAIRSETLPQKEFLDILKWIHEQPVLIYSEKTDQSLVELWEYYGILQQKTRKGYHIPSSGQTCGWSFLPCRSADRTNWNRSAISPWQENSSAYVTSLTQKQANFRPIFNYDNLFVKCYTVTVIIPNKCEGYY